MKPLLRAPSCTLCGLWHSVQVNQRFLPVLTKSPMRLPWMPSRQSRSLSPWHLPHSSCGWSKLIGSPKWSTSMLRLVVWWQSRHQMRPRPCWKFFRSGTIASMVGMGTGFLSFGKPLG
jgi:hypothetical protein